MHPGGGSRATGWAVRLHEAFLGWRNRLVSSAQFQRWAARMPLTRPIAQARATQLFDMATGFVQARVLLAVIDSGLVELLADGALPPEAIARALDLPPGACLTLLKAAAAQGLTEQLGDGRFGLGELGAAIRGNPGLPQMVRHHTLLYRDLEDPLALLRTGRGNSAVARYWPYATGDEDAAAAETYSGLMGESQAMLAGHVLDAVDFGRFRHVLDLGGGEGVFLEAVARQHGCPRLTLMDLPPVAARAKARLAAIGLGGRIGVHPGSFLSDPLPLGADCITLNRVVHDHDDGPVLGLMRAARGALADGGTLVIAEPLAGTAGAAGMGHGYFGLYLHAMGSGRPRTRQELAGMLRASGFARVREAPSNQPTLVRVLLAS
jgi:demethylspheroidene O-methyltransferase